MDLKAELKALKDVQDSRITAAVANAEKAMEGLAAQSFKDGMSYAKEFMRQARQMD